jgi:hypothetical protein
VHDRRAFGKCREGLPDTNAQGRLGGSCGRGDSLSGNTLVVITHDLRFASSVTSDATRL